MPKQRDSLEDQLARRVGAHLREIREFLGLNRKAIAAELHCAERTVKSYEEGTRRLSLADAVRMSFYLNVPLDRLVYGADGPPRVLPRTRMDSLGRLEEPLPRPSMRVVPKAGD